MLSVTFGESTISKTQVQLWYNRFEEGRKDFHDDARRGRPSTSTTDETIEAIRKMILDNRLITIREVDVGISFGLCQVILAAVLDIKRAAAKIIPKLKKFEQKQRCRDIAQEMLMTFNYDPDLLRKVITGDESWVYGYNIGTKAKSYQWKAFFYD